MTLGLAKPPSGQLWANPHPEGNTAPSWSQDSDPKASLAPKGEHHYTPASQTAAWGHVNAWPGPGGKPVAKGLL